MIKIFRKNYYISWFNKKIKKTGIIISINNTNVKVKNEKGEVFNVDYKDVVYTNKYSEIDIEKLKVDESRRHDKVNILNYFQEVTGKSWNEINDDIKDNYNYNLDIANLVMQILISLIDIQKIREFTELIKDEIKKNLLILQKANNGNLFNHFKKIKSKIDDNHLKEFKNFTKIYSVKTNFSSNRYILCEASISNLNETLDGVKFDYCSITNLESS